EPFALASSTIAWSQQYVYDRYGNRRAVIGNNAQSFNINSAKNRLPDFDFSYDEAGNLTKDDLGNSYVYDAENRLTQVFNGDNSLVAEYFYDGNGWRVKKIANGVTTRFVYDQGGRLLAEYIGEPVPSLDAPTKEHIYGASGMLATVEADKINYHTPDHLGTPRILTDGGGQVISRRDTYPFGEQITDSVGNRASVFGYSSTDSVKHLFTGYFKDDESGLDFAQARHFNGALGRFMQPDEFTGGPEEFYNFAEDASDNPTFYGTLANPQSLNKYQYCYNSPLKYVDPSGHGILKRVLKIAKKIYEKGSVAEGFADIAEDIITVVDSNASTTDRVISGLSLATEPLPVGVGDVRDVFRTVRDIAAKRREIKQAANASKELTEKTSEATKEVVRRFDTKQNIKQIKKEGITYDPNRGNGIPTTSTNIDPVNPNKIRQVTGARAADAYVDIDVTNKKKFERKTKAGRREIVIQENIAPKDIVDSGKVQNSKFSK
ncbi:MAG: hypothetical protein JNM06_12565, partial [Blastocatellia bacterium]|nr:hypothetical protein [Blastocatellia bacterium]